MLGAIGTVRAVVTFAFVTIVAAPARTATDVYVAMATGQNGGLGTGSSSHPYQTISYAIGHSTSGDIIKVQGGTTSLDYYTVANGESFPLRPHSGVQIVRDASTPMPRLGGDLTGIPAIVVIDTTFEDASVTGVRIAGLKFMGQNSASVDSPVALAILARDGYSVGVDFENNTCTRPYMNDSGSNGVATVVIDARNAFVSGAISGNVIEASNRGGIEIIEAAGEDETTELGGVFVNGNAITNPTGTAALFGCGVHLKDSNEDPNFMSGPLSISGNTVIGRSGALIHGIEVICEEHTTYNHLDNMDDNVVSGCSSDGIVIGADGWEIPTEPEIAVISFARNRITDNGGSGLVVAWDRDLSDDGLAYIVLFAESSLFADNDEYGAVFRGLGPATHPGVVSFTNCTTCYNGQGGEGFDLETEEEADFALIDWKHLNCIMYANNDTDDQIVGLTSEQLDVLEAGVFSSDWKGIAASHGNIDTDPLFKNVARHEYHLDDSPLSPCVDVGDNAYVAPVLALDIDSEDRIQDGNCDLEPGDIAATVDMGYDELTSDCE